MEKVQLSKGEVTLSPLNWKQNKECTALAEVHSGLMKNSIYFEEAEYRMADKDKDWIDSLSKEDGEKLRAVVIEMLKPDKEKAKN